MKNPNNIFLILILFFSIIFRLYRFNSPIADWHSWRQADTSSVSRNFIKYGFDVFHPKFDDLSNVASGIDNPNGYRFVEFPIYNILQAGLSNLSNILTLEEWGRVVTIFSSVSTVFLIYLIMKKVTSNLTALLSSFFYAFLPYSIYYGRVILPDTSMVTATIASIYFTQRWLEGKNNKNKFFMFAVISASLALLLKPYAIFFLLPVAYLVLNNFGIDTYRKWHVWVFAFFAVAPVVTWRFWMQQYPEGIPANTWLLNGNGIRLRPAFFRWIFYERVFKLICGYFGIIFLVS